MKKIVLISVMILLSFCISSCGNSGQSDCLSGNYYFSDDYTNDGYGIYVWFFDDGVVKCGKMSGGTYGSDYKYDIDYGTYSFEEDAVVIKLNNSDVYGVIVENELVQIGACSHINKSDREDLEDETIAAFEGE